MKRMLYAILSGLLICASLPLGGCETQESISSAGNAEARITGKTTEMTDTGAGETAKSGGALWSVGFGFAEIIPDDYDAGSDSFGSVYYVAGYKNNNPATGMLDPQYARAAYISDKNGSNIVIAAVDCIGLSKADIAVIRERIADIAEQYRLTAVHILTTHTHAGIDTLGLWGPVGQNGKSDSFMEKLYDRTQYAIRRACENARDGSLYYGKADTGDLQRDSRLPKIYDTYVHRFRFAPADNSPGVQIISYAAHAESLRSENSKISADYPCYMGRKIKAETGDDFIFIAGALGGLIMTERQKSADGAEYPVEENVVVTGERLAGNVLSISDEVKLEPLITDKTHIFRVGLDNKVFVMLSALGVLSVQPFETGAGQYGLATETQASLLKLGGVNIALVPGELFPELAYGGSAGELAANPTGENPAPLTEIIGDENLLVWGLCDDELGYIVSPDDFLLDGASPYLSEAKDQNGRNHYEETNSVGIEMAYRLAQAFMALAAE